MTRTDFLAFVTSASRRATKIPGSIGGLHLTTTFHRKNRHRLRETEMRYALAMEAEHRGLRYGFEVPTGRGYRYAKPPAAGRTRFFDLVLFPDEPAPDCRRTILELKAGQPGAGADDSCAAISKDFVKMLREPVAEGRAFLHLQVAASPSKLHALTARYSSALVAALHHDGNFRTDGWFELLLLVQYGQPGTERPQLWRDRRDLEIESLLAPGFAFQVDQLEEVPLGD